MTLKLIRHPNLTLEHDALSDRLCEEMYGNNVDPTQIPTDHWTFERTKQYPFAWTAIELDDKFIGYTFIMPSSIDKVREFVRGKITEKELSQHSIDHVTASNVSALYLAASVIISHHEGRGYAVKSIVSSMQLAEETIGKVPLAYWAFTPESQTLIKKVEQFASKKGYEVLVRR